MPRRRKQRRLPPVEATHQPVQDSAKSAFLKKLIFRLLSVVVLPVGALFCLEAGLRLAGYGYPTSFFLSREINGEKVLIENSKFGNRFFGSSLARTPHPLLIPAVKSTNTCRIFVLGESAAYGDPKPEFGLPRMLEVLLRERLPGVRFEVINAAMTGINSHVMLPIARDCAKHGGDIWVIYAGNNEVVGPFGSGTVLTPKGLPLALIRSAIQLKVTRTGQWISSLLTPRTTQAKQAEWGMGLFVDQQILHNDPLMNLVYSHFSRNLDNVLKVARANGVKVVVSTMLTNLKDCAPFASHHRPDLTSTQASQWEELYHAGIQAENSGEISGAMERFQKAGDIDDQFADLQFRWARSCLALGRDEEAKRHFVLARDYDALRFRADSQINQLIIKAATDREKEGILLANNEENLALESPHRLLGEELLYEHVHLNFEGNYRVARNLAGKIMELLPDAVSRQVGSATNWLSASECAKRLAWTEWEHYQALKSVMLRINAAPFTSQLNHSQRYRRLQHEMEALLPETTPTAMREAVDLNRLALGFSKDDWVLQKSLGDLLLTLGDLHGAEMAFKRVIELMPYEPLGFVELGSSLIQAGRSREALEQFETALRLDPQSVSALSGSALALLNLGQPDEAIRRYETALRIKPNSFDVHLNLGTAMASLKRPDQAREQFRQALQYPQDTPEALMRLGKICFNQGWTNEALTNFTRAVELNPTDGSAHFLAGGLLDALGREDAAQEHITESVRLTPDNARAHFALGVLLHKQGKLSEATEQLSEAVRLNPSLVDARLHLGVTLLKQQRAAEARQQFQDVLRIDATNATAKKMLETLDSQAAHKN